MSTRKFVLDGADYYFNFVTFKQFFNHFANGKIGAYEAELGDSIGVSKETIHAWRNKCNGPSDLEKIKDIAEVWNIDYFTLLKKGDVITNINLSDRQKNSVYRVYSFISDFLAVFSESGGLFAEFPQGIEIAKTQEEQVEFANKKYMDVKLACLREYTEIGKHPLYEEIKDFIENDLIELYLYDDSCDKKIDFEYRQFYNDGFEDEVKCRKKLNDIIDKYI